MRHQALAALAVFTLGATLPVNGQVAHDKVLDLRTPDPASPDEFVTSMRVTGGASTGRPLLPVRLELSAPPVDVFTLADRFTFDLIMENTGDEAIRLPWARRRAELADVPLEKVVTANFILRLVDRQGLTFDAAAIVLGGVRDEGSSTTLLPRERARVIIPMRWMLPIKMGEWLRAGDRGQVSVVAVLRLYEGHTSYQPVTSANSVQVSIDPTPVINRRGDQR